MSVRACLFCGHMHHWCELLGHEKCEEFSRCERRDEPDHPVCSFGMIVGVSKDGGYIIG